MKVKKYIKENWEKTFRKPSQKGHGIISLPKPFSSPSIEPVFEDFYYWDTYFINLGLLTDGFFEQAKNNLDNIAYLIRHKGYMPNASHLDFTSQPPLFTRAVFDYRHFSNDDSVLDEYFDAILKEYEFFSCDRNTKIGLNQYGCVFFLKTQIPWLYGYMTNRAGEGACKNQIRSQFIRGMFAIYESGWDTTPRFPDHKTNFAAHKYVQVDLNSIIFDMEVKIAEIFRLKGDTKKSQTFERLAFLRKSRMNRYMINRENGIYYDYNFTDKRLSPVASVASLYPYVFGIADDKIALKTLLKKIELDYGIAACENHGNSLSLQWDYPIMWAPLVYFTHEALIKNDMLSDAKRIAEKYLQTVRRNFIETGYLSEKYNAQTGEIATTRDSEANPMLGWTGGVYTYLFDLYCKN